MMVSFSKTLYSSMRFLATNHMLAFSAGDQAYEFCSMVYEKSPGKEGLLLCL